LTEAELKGEFQGHAVLISGFDDSRQALEIKNSWVPWGDAGYGWVPYGYLRYGADIWTAVDLDPNPPPGLTVVNPATTLVNRVVNTVRGV